MVRNGLKSILLLGLGLSMMPGCIAWEIRDDLRRTNELVDKRLALLESTNDLLAAIKVDLDQTKQELAEVKGQLATTNKEMADIHDRLAVLDPIQKSLDSLDDSLKTVKGLIEKIPFVGGGDEEKPPAEPASGERPATGSGAPAK